MGPSIALPSATDHRQKTVLILRPGQDEDRPIAVGRIGAVGLRTNRRIQSICFGMLPCTRLE